MRIVLSNIGTYGDINPLIALALELRRRGHVPVMALPAVYQQKIAPLGLEFHAVRPDIDPTNNVLVEMVYDIKHGTEHGLRNFLFPSLRQTYDDLLDAATKPARADLLLLGELNYAGPIVAEVTGNQVGQLCAGAAFIFFGLRSAGTAAVSEVGARRQGCAGIWPRHQARGAIREPQVA